MFSSETIRSRDMSRISSGFNLSIPANMNNLKQVSSAHEGEFIGSDFFPNQNQQAMSSSCGLARYKSAPSSFLAALLDPNNTDNSSSGDESEAFFSALITSGPTRDLNHQTTTTTTTSITNNDGNHHHQYDMVKQEESSSSEARPGKNGSVLNGQMGYEGGGGGGGCIVGSYSVGMETQVNNISSSLASQTTSRAGFFNGFGVMAKGAISSSDDNAAAGMIMSNHINFSSAAPSSSTLNITRFMPSIPENGNHQDIIIATHNPPDENNGGGDSANVREFHHEAVVFPHDSSWNDSPFSLKRNRDGEMRMFSDYNGLDNQNIIGESRKGCSGLVHHLSLPKTCNEMAQVEKVLQFQPDLSTSVPCQVRAKRGFATHPRSIAERMRRTRISEKMKKLQDLFPNMDKQTSTADMLDLAVEYIKDLQKQVETLTDTKAKCICSK